MKQPKHGSRPAAPRDTWQVDIQAHSQGSSPVGIIKRIVDLAMIVLLPLLMAEILTGQEIHEWLGTGMLVLFLAHHFLNLGWWKSFLKGKYTPSRTLGTALDLLLLLDMFALCVSGIMMSGFVFRFLHIKGGMILARQLHLFASHWDLILMSAHLGMHMELFMGLGRRLFRLSEKNATRTCVLRIAAIVLSAYGLYAFITQHMTDYLFLQTHFVMFDETKAAAVYFAETVAEMSLFAAAAYYINKLLCRIGKKSGKKQANGQCLKAIAILVPIFVCILVVAGLNLPSQGEPWQGSQAESPEESSASRKENTAESFDQAPGDNTEEKEQVPDGGFNLGIRLVRNAVNGTGTIISAQMDKETEAGGKVLIVYFSWGGNTRGIAEEIQSQTGADLFEIELVTPYSTDYNTVLDQAQHDQNIQARPEIKNQVEDFEQYDIVILGYPNWWASIPMPIASFLEEYNFSGKTIIPFCSHGGGRFGQSLTAIAKLAPDAVMGEPLSVHYSGGGSLPDDIAAWLELNQIPTAE